MHGRGYGEGQRRNAPQPETPAEEHQSEVEADHAEVAEVTVEHQQSGDHQLAGGQQVSRGRADGQEDPWPGRCGTKVPDRWCVWALPTARPGGGRSSRPLLGRVTNRAGPGARRTTQERHEMTIKVFSARRPRGGSARAAPAARGRAGHRGGRRGGDRGGGDRADPGSATGCGRARRAACRTVTGSRSAGRSGRRWTSRRPA